MIFAIFGHQNRFLSFATIVIFFWKSFLHAFAIVRVRVYHLCRAPGQDQSLQQHTLSQVNKTGAVVKQGQFIQTSGKHWLGCNSTATAAKGPSWPERQQRSTDDRRRHSCHFFLFIFFISYQCVRLCSFVFETRRPHSCSRERQPTLLSMVHTFAFFSPSYFKRHHHHRRFSHYHLQWILSNSSVFLYVRLLSTVNATHPRTFYPQMTNAREPGHKFQIFLSVFAFKIFWIYLL